MQSNNYFTYHLGLNIMPSGMGKPVRTFSRDYKQFASKMYGKMENSAVASNSNGREMTECLKKFADSNGMPISQENGQRCYGPPKEWTGPPPSKGSEVFVGKLPRDIYEPDIVPLFQNVGTIYEVRLMMDFSGTNRGYCFVQFTKPEDAQKAIRELDGYEIVKGRKIGVLKSIDNCRLFVGGLPKDKTEDDIFHEISGVTDGVRKVIAYPSAQDKTKNRGFAFIEYDSHKSAAMARRKMIPGKVTLWGHDVCVDWAEPEPEVQNLYVRNLMLSTTEETLRNVFNEVSSNGVERVKKIKDYAFVHFVSREQADAARIALNNREIEGAVIEITWAKPVDKASPTKSRSPSHRGSNNASRNGSSSMSPSPQSAYYGTNGRDRPPKQLRGMQPQTLFPTPDLANQMLMYGYSPVAGHHQDFQPSTFKFPMNTVEELSRACRLYGWSEPMYKTFQAQAPDGTLLGYYCMVLLTQDESGMKSYQSEGYYPTIESARVGTADGVLRLLFPSTEIFAPRAPALPLPYLVPPVAQAPTPFAN